MPRIVIAAGDAGFLDWLNDLQEIAWDDLREVVRLDTLMAENGGRPDLRVLADQPVWCGPVPLYAPSLGALEFLRRGLDWFPAQPTLRSLLLAWTCRFSRRPRRFARMTCRAAAERILRQWAAELPVTVDELDAAATAALEGFPIVARLSADSTTGTLAWVARHMEKFGGSIDYWLWEQPARRVLWIGRELANAETREGAIPPGQKETIKALAALQRDITQRSAAAHV